MRSAKEILLYVSHAGHDRDDYHGCHECALSAIATAQREAIEAAAKVVEQYGGAWDCTAQQFAREIRALLPKEMP